MSRRLSNCFNYTGSKFRFLDIIHQYLPQDKNCKFLDVFGGGGDISINSFYTSTTYNEKNKYVYGFLSKLKEKSFVYNMGFIFDIINQYQLDSRNVDGYNKLRSDFNMSDDSQERYYYLFYMLCCHSNSNMIRFNGDGYFNIPFGKRSFNKELRAKLRYASERMKIVNPVLLNKDFRDIDFKQYDVIYLDPPYIGTDATYNECGAWTLQDDKDLYNKLTDFSAGGGKFLLSNQRISKGVVNEALMDFVNSNKNLHMIDVESDYDNCNYQRKSIGNTVEILVKNY